MSSCHWEKLVEAEGDYQRRTLRHYETEVKAYERLASLQGRYVPKFIAANSTNNLGVMNCDIQPRNVIVERLTLRPFRIDLVNVCFGKNTMMNRISSAWFLYRERGSHRCRDVEEDKDPNRRPNWTSNFVPASGKLFRRNKK